MEESNPSASSGASPEVQAEQDDLIRKIRKAENHYQVLDLPTDCEPEAVKKKYRRMALRLHPDKCDRAGGIEAYEAIDLAHQTLADAEKRKKYDYLLTLHRGRFRPDVDNHIASEGGYETEGDVPEGGYIRAFAVSFIVIAATVGLYLYARLKVEIQGFTGKNGLPLHVFTVVFVLTLAAGMEPLEVFKWTTASYFATKGAEMIQWKQLWEFQRTNASNMYGVPFWVGVASIPISYYYLSFDFLSSCIFGILEVVVVGIAVLRSEASVLKWLSIYGFALFALAYVAGLSGGIAAVLALVVFNFGSSMPTATTAILGIIILFFAYKISPVVCMLVLLVTCLFFRNGEILLICCTLTVIIGLWNYGWLITFAFLLEIYLVRYASRKEPYGKRYVASVALFVSIVYVGEASIFAAVGAVLVLLLVCYVLMQIGELDQSYVDDKPGRSKKTAARHRTQDATKREKKEAKRDAKKAGRRK